MSNNFGDNQDNEGPQDYSLSRLYNIYDANESKENKNKNEMEDNSGVQNSDSELDIYSDIETVSTSKPEEIDAKYTSPAPTSVQVTNTANEDDNESDIDLIIDTEKSDPDKYDPATVFDSDNDEDTKEEAVTSTSESVPVTKHSEISSPHWNSEIQSETVQSSNQNEYLKSSTTNEDENQGSEENEDEDDCPNSNVYSSESLSLAKDSDLNNLVLGNISDVIDTGISSPISERVTPVIRLRTSGLYSDSEDENVVKINNEKPFAINDIRNMTEDISEEERSYTPCLDEKEPAVREGLDGLDTEMISDDDKNDFEETQEQELKTVSDGDALEINAKESELDFTRPEDCEEGEIVDKTKLNKSEDIVNESQQQTEPVSKPKDKSSSNKENKSSNKEPIFKKLSKNNRERNYRDKENKGRSKSKEKKEKERNTRDRKEKRERKEKRREIIRYDVRSLVDSKPKQDEFGRDPTRRHSYSSSKSVSPSRKTREGARGRSGSRSSRSLSPRRLSRNDFRKRSASYSSRLVIVFILLFTSFRMYNFYLINVLTDHDQNLEDTILIQKID